MPAVAAENRDYRQLSRCTTTSNTSCSGVPWLIDQMLSDLASIPVFLLSTLIVHPAQVLDHWLPQGLRFPVAAQWMTDVLGYRGSGTVCSDGSHFLSHVISFQAYVS